MDMKISLQNLRVAPRKVRLVINLIRGKSLVFAEQQLQFMHKAAAVPLLKMLRSAKANAKNNFDIDAETLYIKSIIANEGPTLTRYSPKAFGSADVIRKRSTHIHAIIADRASAKDADARKTKGSTIARATKEKAAKPKKGAIKPKTGSSQHASPAAKKQKSSSAKK